MMTKQKDWMNSTIVRRKQDSFAAPTTIGEFMEKVVEAHNDLINGTENDEEVLRSLFEQIDALDTLSSDEVNADTKAVDVVKQLITVAAAAMIIALPKVVEDVIPTKKERKRRGPYKLKKSGVETIKEKIEEGITGVISKELISQKAPLKTELKVVREEPEPVDRVQETLKRTEAFFNAPPKEGPMADMLRDAMAKYPAAKKVQDAGALHDNHRNNSFFVYKHHSNNMMFALKDWLTREYAGEWEYVAPRGWDKNGKPLIKVYDEHDQPLGIILCHDDRTRIDCLTRLNLLFPNKVEMK